MAMRTLERQQQRMLLPLEQSLMSSSFIHSLSCPGLEWTIFKLVKEILEPSENQPLVRVLAGHYQKQ
jgi:hypothetical protein